jgi:hypothetical protein
VSRRPELFLVSAIVLLAGCGSKNDTPAKPAVAPSKPAVSQAPAQTESPAPPAASATTTEPPFTPGTSLPGAIPPSPAPSEAKPDKPADPLQWLQDSQARRADYKKQVAEAEANVQVANASIADWERTILAFKNPYRPRPQLAPEDAQAIEGKDGIWRVSWAEGKLAAATAARDAAQKTLDDLKANPPN